MDAKTRKLVIERIQNKMDEKIHKLTVEDPFKPEDLEKKNPFGFRLVPDEVWKGSKFERSFVTTLGQGIFEQIARIIAEGTGAYAENQHKRDITLNTFQNETIDNIIARQTSSSGKNKKIISPDLNKELEQIRSLDTRSQITISTISDLYVQRPNGQEEFYSFKTVKPNRDQTSAAKRILLALRTYNSEFESYFGLPYNPAGEGNPYAKSGHSIPRKLFDMEDRNFVLIGPSLWNKIGDSPDTYNELLDIFNEAGQTTAERIRREYFGINKN